MNDHAKKPPRVFTWHFPMPEGIIHLEITSESHVFDMQCFDALEKILAISRRGFERERASKFVPLAFTPQLPLL